MATINHIRRKTLEKILLYTIDQNGLNFTYGGDLQNCLPFAWVCREWRAILLPRLFSKAYIRVFSTSDTTDTPVIGSNIRLIVENDFSHYALKLNIVYNVEHVDTGNIVKYLNGQHFHKAKWPYIYYLRFFGSRRYTNSTQEGTVNFDTYNTISEYLHKHLPALTHMDISLRKEPCAECPLSHLINFKLYRLAYLYVTGPPVAFKHHSFASSLTYIDLFIGQEQLSLPNMYAPTLHTLRLYNISPDFSWRCFLSDNKESYEFSNLESMTLEFQSNTATSLTAETPAHSDTRLLATGSRRFYAPKLKELSLQNIPSSYAQLLAPLFCSNLKYLNILGSFEALSQMNLRFPYSKFVTISMNHIAITDIQVFNDFAEDLFSSVSIATDVTFVAESYLPLSINNVGWQNVTFLSLQALISRASFYRLVSQLPVLTELSAMYITPDTAPYSTDIKHIVSAYNPDKTTISNSLLRFSYMFGIKRYPLVYNLDILYEFITNVTSLKHVTVPEYHLQEFKDCLSQNSIKRFPHVQNIIFEYGLY